MEPAAGTQVTPHVRLVRELGRGGMGSVWVGEHLKLGTEVAVKFISLGAEHHDPQLVMRFEREARSAAQIKSPHVVHTYDHGVMPDGTPYIIMELLQGESLATRLRRGALCPAETARVVAQVARALGDAHERGIIHRDIKPDNIFLQDAHGEIFVKVLDFGIAKQTELPDVPSVTATGVVLGTPEFMSPEQLLHIDEVDRYVDLWALAVVAYVALLGRPPFAGETLISLCLSISTGQFPPPSQVDPALPSAFDGWFGRALNLDRELRFSSATELARAFDQVVATVPSVAPALAPTEPVATPPAGFGAGSVPTPPPGVGQAGYGAQGASAGYPPAPTPMAYPGAAHPTGPQPPPERSLIWIGWVVAAVVLVGAVGFAVYWNWAEGQRAEARDERLADRRSRTAKKNATASPSASTSGSPGPTAVVKTPRPTATGKKPPMGVGGKAQIRGAMLGCWHAHEGGQPGQAGSTARVHVMTNATGNPVQVGGVWGPHKQFRKCARPAILTKTYAPNTRYDLVVHLPANKSAPAPSNSAKRY